MRLYIDCVWSVVWTRSVHRQTSSIYLIVRWLVSVFYDLELTLIFPFKITVMIYDYYGFTTYMRMYYRNDKFIYSGISPPYVVFDKIAQIKTLTLDLLLIFLSLSVFVLTPQIETCVFVFTGYCLFV